MPKPRRHWSAAPVSIDHRLSHVCLSCYAAGVGGLGHPAFIRTKSAFDLREDNILSNSPTVIITLMYVVRRHVRPAITGGHNADSDRGTPRGSDESAFGGRSSKLTSNVNVPVERLFQIRPESRLRSPFLPATPFQRVRSRESVVSVM